MLKSALSFLKEIRSRMHNAAFYRILLISMIMITIPTFFISVISINYSTESIIAHASESSITSLHDKKSIIEQRLSEVDNLAYQMYTNKDMTKLLRMTAISFQESFTMRNVIDHIYTILDSNKLIDSIYIHDEKNKYIISNSKYLIDDFPDREIIEIARGIERQFVFRESHSNIISYIRRFNVMMSENSFVVIVNINFDALFNPDSSQVNTYDALVFDGDCAEIFLGSEKLTEVDTDIMRQLKDSNKSSEIITIDGIEYFACKVHMDVTDWVLVYLQPYSNIVHQASLVENLIVSSLLSITILSMIIACISSIYIYNPIGHLAKKMSGYLPDDSVKFLDAYKSIDNAVKELLNKNYDFEKKYQTVFPYFKQYSIYNLLSKEIFDQTEFENILDILGVEFEHGHYFNAIVDFENTESIDNERRMLEKELSEFGGVMHYVMFHLGKTRFSIIINTDLSDEKVCEIMSVIKKDMSDKGILMTLSIGDAYDRIQDISFQHKQVLTQMENISFKGKDISAQSGNTRELVGELVYDKKLREEIVSCVIIQNSEGALSAFERLIGKNLDNHAPFQHIHYVCFQVLHDITYALDNMGVDFRQVGHLFSAETFDSILHSGSLVELKHFFEVILLKCVTLIEEHKSIQNTIITTNIVEYLKSNYSKDISLGEVSKKIFLSPGYMNAIFKTATGFTIYEYLTKIRMEAALNLLKNTDCKVQDIASRVGYHNIQSFLRLFKKHYNMTPNKYRGSLRQVEARDHEGSEGIVGS